MVHIGSWGTPDLGITEGLQSLLKPQQAYADSGGSNLIGSTPAPASTGTGSNMSQEVMSTGTPGGPSYADNPPPTNNNNASSGGSGGGGQNLKDPYTRPAGEGWFWDASDGWKQAGGGSGGSNGPSQAEIDAVFDPLFSSLNNAESTVRSGYNTDVQGVDSRYGNYRTQFDNEATQLKADATDKQGDFQATLKSALSDAMRAYKALQQQRVSRFGGGSSAGDAVGELSNQEYLRQQGEVGKEGVRGEREFSKEFNNIGMFVAQKKAELDTWKEETLETLTKNLNAQLADIQMQRGQTESAKANARISIIQDSINRARAVQDQDTSFRQNLAIAAVNQLQQTSGKTFSPSEIQAYVTKFMGGNTSIASASSGGGATTVPTYNPNTGSNKDELQGLQGVV